MANRRPQTTPTPQQQEGAPERFMRLMQQGGRRAPTSNAEAAGMGVQKYIMPLLIQQLNDWIANRKAHERAEGVPAPPESNADAISAVVRTGLLGDVPQLPAKNDDWGAALENSARADWGNRLSGNLFDDQSDWDWRRKLLGGGGF